VADTCKPQVPPPHQYIPLLCHVRFFRAMHYSAKRGLAIACRLSSKVIDFGTDRKRVYDFLFGLNSNLGPILPRFRDIRAFVRGKSLFSAPRPYSGENSGVFP